MLCFFYFVVLPIVCIIPLIIFILADAEAERLPIILRQPEMNSGETEAGGGHQQQQMHTTFVVRQPPPPPPRIPISEIMQWHNRRGSYSSDSGNEADGSAPSGEQTQAASSKWQRLFTRIKAVQWFKLMRRGNRSPVEAVRRPAAPAPPTIRISGAGASRARRIRPRVPSQVDPYGGRLFTMTQTRRGLQNTNYPLPTEIESTLLNHQILNSLLIILATFIIFKSPTGLIAICKMFAMDKNSMTVSMDYIYAEIVGLYLYFVGCCINPFIWILFRQDFKYALRKAWKSFVDIYL